MFPSISNATVNSTVITSFTADEICQVGVPTGGSYVVRKNGIIVADLLIDLVENDSISISQTAPSLEKTASYTTYTYNGATSVFAVVTKLSDSRPKRYLQYKNLVWYDYTPANHRTSIYNPSTRTQTDFEITSVQGGSTNQRLAGILDPITSSIYFVDKLGIVRASRILPNKPISTTTVFNASVSDYDYYVLTIDGSIYKIDRSFTVTKSTVVLPLAKTLFNDGGYLCSAWYDQVSSLGTIAKFYDLNNYISSNFSGWGSGTIHSGIIMPHNGYSYVANESRVISQKEGQSSTIFVSGETGQICWMQSKFFIPFPETYEVRSYSIDGSASVVLDTGDYIPYNCVSDNYYVYITCYNSKDILRWDGITSSYTIFSFDKKVTHVYPVDGTLIASHYLDEYDTTYSPNPTISGINLPPRNASINATVGSGYQTFVTDAGPTSIILRPGMVSWVDGVRTDQISNNQTLVIGMLAVAGKVSMPVVIESYAFDYIVTGIETNTNIINISPNILPVASEVIFNLTLPVMLEPSHLSVTLGEITVNGDPYNGLDTVTGGDQIEITVRVPTGASVYYSILHIADSDFVLPIADTPPNDIDIQTARPTRDIETESQFVVATSGDYYLPELINASLVIDGVGSPTSYPVNIPAGTSVTITHAITSGIVADTRYTYLMGPVIYRVTSDTLSDLIPDTLDFGTLVDAIPDFEYISSILTVTGMSGNTPIEIFTRDGLLVSINGSPYVTQGFIELGDSVQVKWNVRNLWTPNLTIYTIVNLISELDIGIWRVTPPTGAYEEPARTDSTVSNIWFEYERQSELLLNAIGGSYARPASVGFVTAPTGFYTTSSHPEETLASTGEYSTSSHPEETLASTGLLVPLTNTKDTLAATGDILPAESSTTADTSSPEFLGLHTLVSAPLVEFSKRSVDKSVKMRNSFSALINPRMEGDYSFAKYDPQPDHEDQNQIWLYDPQPDHEDQNQIWLYDPQPDHETELQGKPYDPQMAYESPQILRYFGPTWDRIVYMQVLTDPISTPAELEQRHYVDIIPFFEVYRPADHELIETTYETSNFNYVIYSHLSPVIATRQKLFYKSLLSTFINEKKFTSNEYLRLGGQPDEPTALALGQVYANGKPVITYQQPEGTFSYIITRGTDLVCEVRETGLFVKAWLLGGG